VYIVGLSHVYVLGLFAQTIFSDGLCKFSYIWVENL